jgi:2,3-bisphosphoglycerate-independent phosphoglycerate mutase
MDLDPEFYRDLARPGTSKIVLLVMDGLGGLPMEPGGPTALEAAETPHLDALAQEGICGLHEPVGPGVTPGSGPAHLALFGYDPLRHEVGRGALAALGVGFALGPQDVAARGNFCTVDEDLTVVDRRAGRISTETCAALCALLRERIALPTVTCFVEPVREHRFLLVLRGNGLSGEVEDTDPQREGERVLEPKASSSAGKRTARLVAEFVRQAREALADREPANMVLLRGFARRPNWPTLEEQYGLRGAVIAGYPMYRGVGSLLGMEVLETDEDPSEEVAVLERHWADHDLFFLHVKATDAAGEDGDWARKVARIAEVDALVPRIRALAPDVLVVTGDHSTPAALRAHSWHPVPVVLWSRHARPDDVVRFGERACVHGALGPRCRSVDLMPLMLANALRLAKYGA